jgi:glycosylphosphatidylinositol transamidase (GPIT) subunit GPI8
MCDILLSTSAFKFNLRRYMTAFEEIMRHIRTLGLDDEAQAAEASSAASGAGAYTRSQFSST